ncbi:hypothetical protein A4H34_03395 [Peptidiphaga gingivicola]|uniref:Uncharacterized protein n=1 Tax=Peptidiphaga gingivicola TaxID=2741497 RepID=A0A179B3G5_9ACTO|nr:hypothetical protein A4H34_03395 [Peptidiphaga gingivicola]
MLSDRNTDMNPEDRDLSQCTFWRSVLSDNETPEIFAYRLNVSQCTFWCSVLCDWTLTLTWTDHDWVSMHLLVLNAFRRLDLDRLEHGTEVSQCTFWCWMIID